MRDTCLHERPLQTKNQAIPQQHGGACLQRRLESTPRDQGQQTRAERQEHKTERQKNNAQADATKRLTPQCWNHLMQPEMHEAEKTDTGNQRRDKPERYIFGHSDLVMKTSA